VIAECSVRNRPPNVAAPAPARDHRSIARSILFGVIRSSRARPNPSLATIAAFPRWLRQVVTDHRCGAATNASNSSLTVIAALCGGATTGATPYSSTISACRQAALSASPR
jgi:hypothetical protein